jgi:hypothetical protein
MLHLPMMVTLWLGFPCGAMSTPARVFVDDSGKHVLSCETGVQQGTIIRCALMHSGENVWQKTLHRCDGAFLEGTEIKVMEGVTVVRTVRPSETNVTTYTDETGSAMFSLNWDDRHFDIDGVVVGSHSVYHVIAGKKLQVSNHSDEFGLCGVDDNGRRLAVQQWTNCYAGESVTRTFTIGLAMGSGLFSKKFNSDVSEATQWLNSVVTDANLIYRQQLNIALKVGQVIIQKGSEGAPSWDDPQCRLGLDAQLDQFTSWQPPQSFGLWHLFDDCYGINGNTVGLAWVGTICQASSNTGVSWHTQQTWTTFAHELGHNFGARHSFEEGQGKTGGIMDYGDGKLNGEYQFNTKYRKAEVCGTISRVVSTCQSFAVQGTDVTTTFSNTPISTNPPRTTSVMSTRVVTTQPPVDGCDNGCKDTLSPSSPLWFNGVAHTSCTSLIAAAEIFGPNAWCSTPNWFEDSSSVCQKTCAKCSCETTATASTTVASPASTTTLATTTKTMVSTTLSTPVATTKAVVDDCSSCRDTLSPSSPIWFNDVLYTSCVPLIAAAEVYGPNAWCSKPGFFEDVYNICRRSCAKCSCQSTTTTAATSTGIQSGDTIFLRTQSGSGKHWDVEWMNVLARWVSRSNWQALVIEKTSGASIQSGDSVFLKTHADRYVGVREGLVQAWNDKGDTQAFTIRKKSGSGAIVPNDVVCLRAHTGNNVDNEPGKDALQARWNECGDWQAMLIEQAVPGALQSGGPINLIVHTGKHIDVEGSEVKARWTDRGLWQRLEIESLGGGPIFSGDTVFLKAHTGMFVEIEKVAVAARWSERGDWQALTIERIGNSRGAILPGDAVVFRAHTGRMIEVEGDVAKARWLDYGSWQTMTIERSSWRRLSNDGSEQQSPGVLFGACIGLLSSLVVSVVLMVVSRKLQRQPSKALQPVVSLKVHPEE